MHNRYSRNFNPLAPCGARLTLTLYGNPATKFQSTRPVWGETSVGSVASRGRPFQSTRPVWGETTVYVGGASIDEFQSTRPVWGETKIKAKGGFLTHISIHSPRVGRDTEIIADNVEAVDFNPLAPCGARHNWLAIHEAEKISIHSPRVGRDETH